EIDARDVEVGLERAQAEGAAADVEDPRRRPRARERAEELVPARAGAGGVPRPDPRTQAGLRGAVDVGRHPREDAARPPTTGFPRPGASRRATPACAPRPRRPRATP